MEEMTPMSRINKRIAKFWRRQVTARLRTGPYRFLIHRWKYISDIDVAIGALETQFYDSQLVSQPLPVDQINSFLVLAPHQDDEAIGAGGTLLLAKKAGADLHILFITDGRSRSAVPYASTPDEVVQVRNREARRVGEILGAKIHHLGINNAKPEPKVHDIDRLFEKIKEISPRVLLVPWLLDTPKHRLVNHLLWLTDRCHSLPNCEIWGYQVHNSLIPNGHVDITEVADEKRRLIECYTSQNLHVKRFDHIAMGMAIWNCRFLPNYKADPVARYVEVFCALPLREHLRLIETFYLPDLDATYRGIPMADGMKKIHKKVMDLRC
jgi:LmbE family N-acetylglucosaminyl deacetylase